MVTLQFEKKLTHSDVEQNRILIPKVFLLQTYGQNDTFIRNI